MHEAVIVDAIRTPVGRRNGVFASVRADDLAADILNALVKRNRLDPSAIDDVVTGCVTQTGEQGFNISRSIVLASGLPISLAATSVSRLCGSGVQAVQFAYAQVAAGFSEIMVALGAENMTRVPMGSDVGPTNEKILDRFAIINQGLSAELIAEKWELSRDVLDQFSYQSHQRAIRAIDAGLFKREIVPYTVQINGEHNVVTTDEGPRRDTSLEKLAGLKPAFKDAGRITAGNSSQISDGAAGILIMTATKAKELQLAPRARIVTTTVVGVDPTIMLTGPIPATQKAFTKTGLSIRDMHTIECNEAFAPIPLAFAREHHVSSEQLNPRGGAIALGHPLGASGARLVTSALHTIEDDRARYGMVTMCIGFGQGITMILERLG